ncbi:multiple sugar transport system substrate-binding protein [Amycolatopsis arida]|uniref:Probable sugar-binding periplasmic protein n=1 Tax=Amycolatopsis arida TaxID=587909 RepID=A0A1I5ZQM3_9PSEU|nr:extracellular solute-binding protein [Amycolatopsis arida]TDX89288.1 multiple sugar transport system substrate-binding protein [Amycolatopsis arida]SFQ58741.1 multiple sugar transport system substrate-binding protein [Amycolatopsis arida]
MRSTTRTGRRNRRAPLAAALLTALSTVTACSGAAGGPDTGGTPAPPPGPEQALTLTVYSNFAAREYDVVTAGLNRLRHRFPNIEIRHEGSQDDAKLTAAIRGGNPPDVAISFYTDNLGAWCENGTLTNLGPYLERDGVDLGVIPQAVRDYTEHEGTRCAMPMLADVYGFYYNTEMFAAAGLDAPPRTTDELFEYATRLTRFNPDGSIAVAGFLPSMPFYGHEPHIWAPSFGASFLDAEGRSHLAESPEWHELFRFQKRLVDFYGYERLEQFRAGLGDEFSADHGFHRGKVAMMIDGEYRTAFLREHAPDLPYATAPPPVADADRYGTAFTTGTVIGIPRGAPNPGAAWELVKQMSLDTDTLVELANGLRNVPSTTAALEDPRLEVDERYRTFLDLLAGGRLVANPTTSIGDAHLKAVNDFAERWQAGREPDLTAGLRAVDARINDELSRTGGGN